jgi:hypothetical protein
MPRKNTDEVIADLEQKLEEAKARVHERRTARIDKLKEQVTAAQARVTKAQEAVTKLTAELDALIHESEVYGNSQPQAEGDEAVDAPAKGAVKAKSTADASA